MPIGQANHTTPLEDLGNNRSNQCVKVFVQRDYSEGTMVKFQTRRPPELEDKIDRDTFENTIHQLNTYFAEAEKASCSTYCEGCLACLTAYLIYLCSQTHYEKCLRKVAKFIAEQNQTIYEPHNLHITDPIERGLRVCDESVEQMLISNSNQQAESALESLEFNSDTHFGARKFVMGRNLPDDRVSLFIPSN